MGIGDCFSEVKDAIASGKVKTYARVFAVLMVLLMLVVPIVLLATMNPLPPATTACSVVFSVLLGIVELPFCCGCLEACRTMQVWDLLCVRVLASLSRCLPLSLSLPASLCSSASDLFSPLSSTPQKGDRRGRKKPARAQL